ncbi:hypothetical protein DFS33DRAFT_1439103 [Desarmillaria ectypa]|nr:hypothetical protein DFS33DRAFT_1439103 [Desarmillaria ectypa]
MISEGGSPDYRGRVIQIANLGLAKHTITTDHLTAPKVISVAVNYMQLLVQPCGYHQKGSGYPPAAPGRAYLSHSLKNWTGLAKKVWMWDEDSKKSMLEAEIVYEAAECTRSFHYLNPRSPLTIVPLDAQPTGQLHCFRCSSEDLGTSLAILSEPRPKIVYEPLPIHCNPANLVVLKSILPLIDVFSPNHEGLELFLKGSHSSAANEPTSNPVYTYMQNLAHGLLSTVRVLAGACTSRWLLLYWTAEEAKENVYETTGAVNSFLGGLCEGMAIAGMSSLLGKRKLGMESVLSNG